jgi:cytochrome c peroxidase
MIVTLRSLVLSLPLVSLICAGCVEYKPVSQGKGPPASGGANTLSLPAPEAKDSKPASTDEKADPACECQVPSTKLMTPFKDTVPIVFVGRGANRAEWEKLPTFWNELTAKARDPNTGGEVDRKLVKIKVPLGLTQPPPVPLENPLTLDKWKLGKQLYYDKIISSDNSVACATCHDPAKGFTDQAPVSTGIAGKKGGMSAPTVVNAAYSTLQFWDGRAVSLEDQSQGPPQNAVEMYDGEGHAWNRCVKRLRAKPEYVEAFKKAFGTEPTRDAVAKAIASYERTVLSGNSTADRAELAKLARLEEEGKPASSPVEGVDVEQVLKDDLAKKNLQPLKDLGLDPEKDAGKIPEVAKSIAAGRALFIGKARCNTCHVGDNFSDSLFHNLGVGVNANGDIPPSLHGRYGAQPTGHKNPDQLGAFKTPTIRGILSTAPYMHDGSEKTLEAVIDFYDKGGNPSEFLDVNMRDIPAEKFYLTNPLAEFKKQYGAKYAEVKLFNDKPIIPLKLELTPQEKKDLILYMKALQGELVDPIVADPAKR